MFPIITVVFHKCVRISVIWTLSSLKLSNCHINYGFHKYILLIESVKHIHSFVSMPLLCLIFISMLLLCCIHISFWRTCISQMFQSYLIVTSHSITAWNTGGVTETYSIFCHPVSIVFLLDVCMALLQALMAISYSTK